ncbi:unnamed protein product [Prunus armeniaca]
MVSPWPFAQWGLDLIGTMPQGKGQIKFAVVSVDYFTKWVKSEAFAMITAAKIEHFVWKNIICWFGVPNAIITDNEKQFNCSHFRHLCSRFKINIFTLQAHPQSMTGSTDETLFSLAFGTKAVVPAEINAPTCQTTSYDPEQNEAQLALNLDLIEEHRSPAQPRNVTYKQ